MSAFISHSSKDKGFVSQVVAALSSLEVEYDEKTFDFALNVQAIRNALKRSSIVVFFLSQNSVTSTFVQEEQRQALEALGRGDIRRIMILCIDGTSYKELPEWMREINVAYQVSNPKACARRIQSALVEIDASQPMDELYLGRDEEESALRKALASPKQNSPIYLHVSGFHGVGRRTFIRKSLTRMFPRYYESYLEITSPQYGGIEDLYRSLYSMQIVSSLSEMINDIERFASSGISEQVSEIARLVSEIADEGSLILVVDEFSVFDEEGDYQVYWKEILTALNKFDRPLIGFIQTRTQPYRIKNQYRRAFHLKLKELSSGSSKELIALSLKAEGIEFDENQIDQLASLVDGHPFNLRFVVGYARHYGLDVFLRDPRDYIEWKHRRGEEFLNGLEFSSRQVDIVSALAEYRFLSADLILAISGASADKIMEDLRILQDFCCVEYRNGYFHLASPIRESTRRDARFVRTEDWHRGVAQKICDALLDYKDDDHVPLAIIESATIAQARGGAAPAYLKSLILPSHLLVIARELYDRQLRPQCIEFCQRAFEMKGRMTPDAQVETLRLWGLSAARSNDESEFGTVVDLLKQYDYPTARRVRLFLEGFFARLRGRLDQAEARFKEAWDIAPKNSHINRELANLLCRQKRYDEAEQYARSSYDIQRTNPYIIDILLETLIGKRSNGDRVDDREIDRLREELKTHSEESETLFYFMRQAQSQLVARDYEGASNTVSEALALNDAVPAAYFLGIDVELRRRNVPAADRHFIAVKDLLERQGQSEGDECKLFEAEVGILAEKRQYLAAKRTVDGARNIPIQFANRVRRNLSKAILFDSKNANMELISWANANRGV